MDDMLNNPRVSVAALLAQSSEVLAARQELGEPLHASFAFPCDCGCGLTYVVTVSPATEVIYDSVFSEIQ